MENYIIELIGGGIIKINQTEVDSIRGSSGLIHISRLNRDINISSIKQILLEQDYKIEKENSNVGVLNDGQSVIKRFGVWYINDGSFQIAVDPNYHPEITQDKVMSPQEYERYKLLPEEEKLKLLTENNGN